MNVGRDRERELLVWLNSRTVALTLYGLMGIEVGAATVATGAGPLLEDLFGTWIRLVIGGVAFVGGLLTFAGSLKGDRTYCGWWATLLGSFMLATWALGGCVSYAAVTAQTGIDFLWPWEPVSPDVGRLATPLFYQSILLLILLHVVTLLRLGRPDRD